MTSPDTILMPRPRISGSFENTSFLSVLSLCPHGDGVFGHGKGSFSKRFPEWIFSKTLVFSCCRVDGWKRSFSKNADVAASIYHIFEHALSSLEITPGHFAYLFSSFYILYTR